MNSNLRSWVAEHALFLGGIVAVIVGTGKIYPPLAWILGGAIAIFLGVVASRERHRSKGGD